MVYRGHVENGMIRLEDAPVLPDGVEAEVRLLTEVASHEGEGKVPSVCDALTDFVGKAEGLPPDASINHDHYLRASANFRQSGQLPSLHSSTCPDSDNLLCGRLAIVLP